MPSRKFFGAGVITIGKNDAPNPDDPYSWRWGG
jgi:hypothetical protein